MSRDIAVDFVLSLLVQAHALINSGVFVVACWKLDLFAFHFSDCLLYLMLYNNWQLLDRLQYVFASLTLPWPFDPTIIPSVGYPKIIPYTKFEHFGIIRFWIYHADKQNHTQTRMNTLLTWLPSAWVIIIAIKIIIIRDSLSFERLGLVSTVQPASRAWEVKVSLNSFLRQNASQDII